LSQVTTATLTTILLNKGLRNVWVRGTKPIRAGQPRLVGRAFTLRFVPVREDLATPASSASPISTRAVIEAMPAGCVAVVDAMGNGGDGRGDIPHVLNTGLPIWCNGAASPPSVAGLTFVSWQEPIGCGGVAVFPGDVIVVELENWIMAQVEKGAALPGLYPPNAEN
jgi:regulator of RNase E activity RraA